MSQFGPYDDTALRRLLARALKWTPEERAYHNERFREIGRQYARYLRFEQNARQAWDDWLATTRIARSENDDAKPP
jgi:hypothetical protein